MPARLEVFKNGELVETYDLSASKRIYKVGRQAGFNDITLPHASISREHATFTISASGSVVVTDLGSAQGTHLSGKRIEPKKSHMLAPGRSLVFGKSTRVFKLCEGATGFSTGEKVAGAQAGASDPMAQPLLRVLRNGAHDCERPRPDGFVSADALLMCSLVVRGSNCFTASELAALVARESALEALKQEGRLYVRAKEGHAEALRVDASLQLRLLPQLPQILVCGILFRQLNVIRSGGLGAVGSGASLRLCVSEPQKGTKLHGLGRCAEVLVFVRTEFFADDGIHIYEDLSSRDAPCDALVSSGNARGVIGPWHFDKVVMVRDGSLLMAPEDIEPVRAARIKEVEAARAKAAADQAARLQRQKEAEAAAAEEAERERILQGGAAPTKYNPYLEHIKMAPPPRASNRSAAVVPETIVLTKRPKLSHSYEEYEEEEE